VTLLRSRAPGRVNLNGDHTDYTGGFVLPMAIDLATTVEVRRRGDVVRLRSDRGDADAVVPLDITEPSAVAPSWARYVAGVVAELRPTVGAVGTITTDLPLGAGLSSSAALEVASALALGFDGDALALAQLCQRAERRASGVPCGIMDQLAIAAGVEGSLLLIDCESLTVAPHPLPDGVAIVGVHSGVDRELSTSPYSVRHVECMAAERELGSLRHATLGDVEALTDPVVRRRARHVVTENARVLAFVDALRSGRFTDAGALMDESHASLRHDFEVSTPIVDDLVARLRATPGVLGARMTGGGFGGVVVALCDAGAQVEDVVGGRRFRPAAGASVEQSA
jgi:galactokinase